jgi:hypothetical protein
MTRMKLALAAILALPLAAASCSDLMDESTAADNSAALGDALAGTNAALFAEAKDAFTETETALDGLGPIFNERSCGQCHAEGAFGGAGQQIERRYGTLTNGVFNSLPATGGSLRQLFGIGGFTPSPGQNCNANADRVNPVGATIFAGRLTTPVFGLGLVELIPDGTIQGIAAAQPASIRGVAVLKAVQLPSGGFTRGQVRVARFGWKAVHSTLSDFSGDAYLNEMGITTTSCNNGQVLNDFAIENRTDRAPTNAVINGCPDDMLPGVDDAGRRRAVRGVHARPRARAARHRQQQRPRPHGVQPRGLQRLPRHDDLHGLEERTQLLVPAVLRLPRARHGVAG